MMRTTVSYLMLMMMLYLAIAATADDTRQAKQPAEGEILVNGRVVRSLQQAFDYVTPQGIIRMGPGVFKTSGVLKKGKDFVTLTGTRDTWLDGVAKDGKAAITIRANGVTIRYVNCRNIAVKARNGSCIRHEGGDLSISHVHFKDSESGVLAWKKAGKISISDCLMENIGAAGKAHALYLAGREAVIERCRFIGAKDQAHSIKSRSQKTTIRYNVVASAMGNDSRLIDIPNGGDTLISDNLLIKGANSVNNQILSWGVEANAKKPPHANSTMRFVNNTVINDRAAGAKLVLVGKLLSQPIISGNAIIGKISHDSWPTGNYFFTSRAELGLPPAPAIPDFKLD